MQSWIEDKIADNDMHNYYQCNKPREVILSYNAISKWGRQMIRINMQPLPGCGNKQRRNVTGQIEVFNVLNSTQWAVLNLSHWFDLIDLIFFGNTIFVIWASKTKVRGHFHIWLNLNNKPDLFLHVKLFLLKNYRRERKNKLASLEATLVPKLWLTESATQQCRV